MAPDLPVALGEALGELLQLAQRCLAPYQRLVMVAQLAQGEHRAALEAHFMQYQPGVGRGPVGVEAQGVLQHAPEARPRQVALLREQGGQAAAGLTPQPGEPLNTR